MEEYVIAKFGLRTAMVKVKRNEISKMLTNLDNLRTDKVTKVMDEILSGGRIQKDLNRKKTARNFRVHNEKKRFGEVNTHRIRKSQEKQKEMNGLLEQSVQMNRRRKYRKEKEEMKNYC